MDMAMVMDMEIVIMTFKEINSIILEEQIGTTEECITICTLIIDATRNKKGLFQNEKPINQNRSKSASSMTCFLV